MLLGMNGLFVYLVNVCLVRLFSGHALCLVDVLFGYAV